jgi:hypothetical protein
MSNIVQVELLTASLCCASECLLDNAKYTRYHPERRVGTD